MKLERSGAAPRVLRHRRFVMETHGKTVVVVDDDPSLCSATKNFLDAHGYVTECYVSAHDFLDRGRTSKIDCLVLDIHLSGMSGIELRDKLRDAGNKTPVIFVTADNDAGIRAHAVKAGCAAYLMKPFVPCQLVEAIEKATI
jgi:FixJ family two-component response regulator